MEEEEEKGEEFGKEHPFKFLINYETISGKLDSKEFTINPAKVKNKSENLLQGNFETVEQLPARLKNMTSSAMNRVMRKHYMNKLKCCDCGTGYMGVSVVRGEENECVKENEDEFCNNMELERSALFSNKNFEFLEELGQRLKEERGIDIAKGGVLGKMKEKMEFGKIDLAGIFEKRKMPSFKRARSNRHYLFCKRNN